MKFLSQASAAAASNAIIAVFAVALTLFCIGALIVLLCKYASDGDGKIQVGWFVAACFIGVALRLVFALCVRGFRDDYAVFSRMFNALDKNGLGGYYTGDSSNVLYPVVYFVYLIFGGLSNATGLSDYELGMQFMIKLPLVIADMLAALAVYLTAKRYFNKKTAFALFAFVCVCPIFFIGSSLWCTPVCFTVMFACFGCMFLAKKQHALTIAFFTAAAFSSKEGIYLFPVACVFSCYHLVRAIVNVKNAKPQGKAVLGADYRAVITVPVGFVLSVLVAYLLGLFLVAPHSYSFFGYIYEFLLAPFVDWSYFTTDGLSIYSIFGQSGAAPSARFPSWVFAAVFMAIVIAVVCVVYFTKRNRATLVMLAAYSIYTMETYYPGSSAIGFTSVLLLLAAAYALVKDKRLLTVLFVAGLAYVINAVTTLAGFGYLNNLADYNFGTEGVAQAGAFKAVTITCSVFALLAHLYFTYVAVSVGMTGQKRMLEPANGVLASFKEYFSIKKG